MSYVHLKVHSEFSSSTSIVKIPELLETCIKNKMPAVAITDDMNIFAIIKFYQMALKKGIKPIIGCRLSLEDDTYLSVLCENNEGYYNLLKLLSKAYVDVKKKPHVTYESLKQYSKGLIVLTGCKKSLIYSLITKDDKFLLKHHIEFLQSIFKDNLYLTLENLTDDIFQKIALLQHEYKLNLVGSYDVFFLKKEELKAKIARVCINQSLMVANYKTYKNEENEYFKNYYEIFEDFKNEIILTNTTQIAKKCNVILPLNKVNLPDFTIPKTQTLKEYLKDLAFDGLRSRKLEGKIYDDRINHELEVITSMGFSGYFLIVADFINWAKKNNVLVGPGRGSGAGSLVAYSLGITDINPIDYDLLFERFLNPERVSMPDFDIDFCIEGRDRVIQYIANKYGHKAVSQIITFGTLGAKAVVRDVGRVLGYGYFTVDKIAKLIPFAVGMTLEKALKEEELIKLYNEDFATKNIIDLSLKLEGLVRNVGRHAGGVVIAPKEITDFSAIYRETQEDFYITHYDKDDIETAGLIKFDLLGLKTLTVIDKTTKLINDLGIRFNINNIPVTDQSAYKLICKTDTSAVFQLESRGMKDLISRLQPDKFEDIIALVALFRPGPLQSGMVDDFIAVKHKKAEAKYIHPSLKETLKPTYGVILYQEQVMEIARKVGGYTLGSADILRRAMGKKKPEEMAKQKSIFISGAMKNDVSEKIATTIFDLMDKFSGYGFNKSHSAAYALLSFQTAWLKANYPAQFMTAVLTLEMENTEKLASLISEIKKTEVKINPLCINQSIYDFSTNQDSIVYGLGAIKGLGKGVISLFIDERDKNGPYKSLEEFIKRNINNKITKKNIETLIYAGAFDKLSNKSEGLSYYLSWYSFYENNYAQTEFGQNNLFGENENTLSLPKPTKFPLVELMNYEFKALGLFFTLNPIDLYEQDIKQLGCYSLDKINTKDETVRLSGFVSSVKRISTKSGLPLYFVTIDDQTALVDLVVTNEIYNLNKDLYVKQALICVICQVSKDKQGQARYRVTKANFLQKLRENLCRKIHIKIDNVSKVDEFKKIIDDSESGKCEIIITDNNNNNFLLPSKIKPMLELTYKIEQLVGKKNVTVDYISYS